MKKALLLIAILICNTTLIVAQATEEQLESKKVKNFIVINPDVEQKKMGYQLDNDEESRAFKNAVGRVSIGVAEKGELKQVRFETTYLNPFKYRLYLSDTILMDDSYKSITAFLERISGFSNMLIESNALVLPVAEPVKNGIDYNTILEAQKNKRTALAPAKIMELEKTYKAARKKLAQAQATGKNTPKVREAQTALVAAQVKLVTEMMVMEDESTTSPAEERLQTIQLLNNKLDSLNAPELIAWAYLVRTAPASKWWFHTADNAKEMPNAQVMKKLEDKAFEAALAKFARSHYADTLRSVTDKNRATSIAAKALASNRLYYQDINDNKSFLSITRKAINLIKDSDSYDALKDNLKDYKEEIKKLQAILEEGEQSLSTLGTEINHQFPGEHDIEAAGFITYSRNAFSEFIASANDIQAKRQTVVTALSALGSELGHIVKETNTKESSHRIGVVYVNNEKMRDVTLEVRPREISFEKNGVSIKEDKPIITQIIRIQTYKNLVAEFSTGAFYTNLNYPRYTTQEIDGETRIARSDTKYRAVVAAHLNLIPNINSGLINPIFQLGVGSGKEAPSILAGGGLRFSKPKRVAITGGAIWAFKKRLDKMQEGDLVSGVAAIEDDLKLALRPSPAFYIGIQYGF